MLSRPSTKLAFAPPNWPLRVARKVAGVAATPLIVIVPPEKTISAEFWMTPWSLTVVMVVVPVKPARAVSRVWPTLRPFRTDGAGTADEALCARFSSSARRVISSPRRSAAAGASTSRNSSSPLISPEARPSVSGRRWPFGSVIMIWLKTDSDETAPARLYSSFDAP
ncbi:hypothetical protein D3C71_851890 [compost metagenome]